MNGIEAAVGQALKSVEQWRTGCAGSIIIATAHRDAVARQFAAAGHKVAVIDASQNLSVSSDVIHFATMHRAKGLEFDDVVVIAPSAYLGDPRDTETRRKLIYVALTRAKRDAVLLKM